MTTAPLPTIPGYTIDEVLGVGGFATVYRARQTALGRVVAIKVMRAAASNPEDMQRFDRECHALGMVGGHPNIVTVHDCGVTEAGHAYLVMALEEGGTLADRIEASGPLAWREAVALVATLADALHRAHTAGVLHRDIKPANVLVSHFGGVRLADFGIARVTGMGQTTAGRVTASVAHAAPEVLDGDPPSVRSDVYSLGSTLVTLLAGTPPFGDESQGMVRLLARIAADDVPDYGVLGIPAGLQALISATLAKDPADRPASAEVLEVHLRTLLTDDQPNLPALLTSSVQPEPVRKPSPEAAPATRPARRRARDVLAGAVAALVLLFGGVALSSVDGTAVASIVASATDPAGEENAGEENGQDGDGDDGRGRNRPPPPADRADGDTG